LTGNDDLKDRLTAAFDRLAETAAMMDRHEYNEAEVVAKSVIEEFEPLIPDPSAGLDIQEPWRSVISVVAFAYNRRNTVNSTYGDLVNAIGSAQRGLELARRINDVMRMVGLHYNLGSAYHNMGESGTAVESMLKALEIAEENDVKVMIGGIYSALGLFSDSAGDMETAEEYLKKGVDYSEQYGSDRDLAGVIHNLGNLYFKREEFDTAISLFRKALQINERVGNLDWASRNINNLGLIHGKIGQYEEALAALHKALDIKRQLGLPIDTELQNLANLYSDPKVPFYDQALAEQYCLQAIEIRDKQGIKHIDSHETLARIRQQQKRYDEAIEALQIAREIERQNAQSDVQQRIEKWRQQKELTEREARERMERAEAAATRALLDTVLPDTIATRMIRGEERIADRFDSVSILFADIVGFTAMTEHLEAEVVIRILNTLFERFDQIIIDHGCEKIKTIGDGYMAVAGAPTEVPDHHQRIAGAAFAMQQTVRELNLKEIDQSLPEHLQIRIGLHCGPVICGVVGRERFVWDVYSDAVNTASRMESTGEPGRIQVSSSFARALCLVPSASDEQNQAPGTRHPALTERGEVNVKGKGTMTTYWLEGA